MTVQPLPGPLDADPTPEVADLQVARTMLAAAVVGLPRGAWDEAVLTWLSAKDAAAIATIASLLRRATVAGLTAGRAEVIDEHPTVQALRAEADALAADLNEARASLATAYAQLDLLRAEAGAADRDRDALTRILAAAADVSARFDARQVSAQGAFERLLTAITDAGGAR